MASAEDYANWIVANADKKGTPEFETVASAYKIARQQSQEPSTLQNVGAGLVRGAGAIGSTILAPIDYATDVIKGKEGKLSRHEQRVADLDRATKELFGANPESLAFQLGKLGYELPATAGVGGALAKGAEAIPVIAKNAPALIEALRTGGFSTGQKAAPLLSVQGAKQLGTRGLGGAVTGGASAALVNPDEAGFGAVIGGALPVAGQVIGSAARNLGRSVSSADRQIAEKLAAQMGVSTDELLSALQQQGPQMIEGYQKTVPQIIQNDFTSQLQRNLKSAGVNALGEAERAQQAQMMQALGRVAPIQDSVPTAAERVGKAISNYAVPARQAATENVSRAFEAIDPFAETALHLPIPEMERAYGKYLGEGTFGTGQKAAQAIETAKRVGTEVLPEIKAITQKEAGKTQNLEQAVRSLGGIRDTGYLSKELQELGRKQSGTTGLIGKTGKDVEKMAELMYERGFISDNDPATLLDALRNKGGRKVFASDVSDNAFQRQFEHAMGDMPEKQVISKAVPYQTIQNLRSSIGEAANTAAERGANKEAGALNKMLEEIDSRINRAAGGKVGEGEYFPKDIADQYRKALALHEAKMKQFETGPQIGMFRKGADKQAQIQGAEIPGKFYSANMSQADDVRAFKKLIADRTDLADQLKSFAVTQMANKESRMGNLGDQFLKFVEARTGANKELFTPNELATINEVAKAVENQIKTEGLGRVSGSDTAQKIATMEKNGLLDNRLVDLLARKIPVAGQFTGPFLDNLRKSATQTRNETMARILANPEEFAKALNSPKENKSLADALRMALPVTRGLPVIAAQ
jgi:uncharacterized protein YidB (DUF937 family)